LFQDRNFLTTNARRPIKGSKNAHFGLVSFKKTTKNCLLGVGAQGQATLAKQA